MKRPDAAQRICEEIERTVWPIDRKFFQENPERCYWLRPAQPAEIAQNEIYADAPILVPPGAIALTAIRQVAPGVRFRVVIVTKSRKPPPANLPEEICREWYHAWCAEPDAIQKRLAQ